MKYKWLLTTCILCSLFLTACADRTDTPAITVASSTESEVKVVSGIDFLQMPLKVISTFHFTLSTSVKDSASLELFVDRLGNGEGLMFYNNVTYAVVVYHDLMFVRYDLDTLVRLTDVTGHGIFLGTNVSRFADITEAGFIVNARQEVENYVAESNGVKIESAYSTVNHPIVAEEPKDYRDVTFQKFTELLANGDRTVLMTEEELAALDIVQEPSSYINARDGITIRGVTYSVGDYCNPTDYFEGQTPSGIIPETKMSGTVPKELIHISWEASDGRFEVMVMDDIVRSIYTNCSFQWLGLNSGTDYDTVRLKVGGRLSAKERELFTPVSNSLIVDSCQYEKVQMHWNNLVIELGITDKRLTTARVNEQIDFLKQGE